MNNFDLDNYMKILASGVPKYFVKIYMKFP